MKGGKHFFSAWYSDQTLDFGHGTLDFLYRVEYDDLRSFACIVKKRVGV